MDAMKKLCAKIVRLERLRYTKHSKAKQAEDLLKESEKLETANKLKLQRIAILH